MRWIWIDRLVSFESGRRASAVKCVSLAEELVHDHFPGFPIMPSTLMIEGMAQTAGILVGEVRGFADNVILAKIRAARFEGFATPGDRLRYDAEIESIDDRGAITQGVVYCNDQKIGSVNLIFSILAPGDRSGGLPERNFVFTDTFLDLLRAFQTDAAAGTRNR